MDLREELKNFSAPELWLFWGIICGCTLGSILTLALFLLSAWLMFRYRRTFSNWLWLGFAAGVLALFIQNFYEAMQKRELPEFNRQVTLECLCTDTRITGVSGMPRPTTFLAEIRRLDGRLLKRSPQILVRTAPSGFLPRCGETFSGRGQLSIFIQDKGFEKYLSSRSIHGYWKPGKLQSIAPPRGFWARLCQCRDLLLGKVLDGMGSQRARIMAGTMFFGTQGGFDTQMKQIYLRSGVLHLFSVSGMHLTVIAAFLLLAVRIFPLKFRYLFLGILLTFYGLSTGGNPPVMRALFVALFWCAGKTVSCRKNSVSLLALAGSVLLLFSPKLVSDIGAQYSFFITFILILTGENIRNFSLKKLAIFQQAPANPVVGELLKKKRRPWRFAAVLLGCLAAFASGIGVAAAHDHWILPAGILLNFFLCFLTPFLFLLVGLCFLPGTFFSACVLEKVLLFLHDLCVETGHFFYPLSFVVGSGEEAFLFSLALFLGVGASSLRLKCLFLACGAGIFALWCLRPFFLLPEMAFISGNSRHPPMIVITEPRENLAFVINVTTGGAIDQAGTFLLKRGQREIEALFFSPERTIRGYMPGLLRKIPARRICLSGEKWEAIRRYLPPETEERIVSGRYSGEFLKIFREKSIRHLEYFNPGSKLSLCIKWQDTKRGRFLSVNDEPLRFIPWKYSPEVLIYGFPEK